MEENKELTDTAPAAEAGGGKKRKKRRGQEIHRITPENDIRFKGVLSYRHLRIMGWIAIAVSQAGIILRFAQSIDPELEGKYTLAAGIMSAIGGLGIFLMLFANFAVIIDKKSTYLQLFLLYGFLTALFIGVYLLLVYRYLGGILKLFESGESFENMLRELGDGSGFFAFNVFLDLLLCTMVVFFMNYRPRRFFTGKKLIWFRLLVLIPVLYEIACIILKALAACGRIRMSPLLFPLLTAKPPMCFLLFVVMTMYIKRREIRYLKAGRSYEEYEAFLKTNANSFQFAKAFSLRIFLMGLLDVVLMFVLTIVIVASSGLEMGAAEEYTSRTFGILTSIGVGESGPMILFAPLALLFSYVKSYKNTLIDLFIPIAGASLIVIVYVEGIYRVICLTLG